MLLSNVSNTSSFLQQAPRVVLPVLHKCSPPLAFQPALRCVQRPRRCCPQMGSSPDLLPPALRNNVDVFGHAAALHMHTQQQQGTRVSMQAASHPACQAPPTIGSARLWLATAGRRMGTPSMPLTLRAMLSISPRWLRSNSCKGAGRPCKL